MDVIHCELCIDRADIRCPWLSQQHGLIRPMGVSCITVFSTRKYWQNAVGYSVMHPRALGKIRDRLSNGAI
jgi:hypothetical protein